MAWDEKVTDSKRHLVLNLSACLLAPVLALSINVFQSRIIACICSQSTTWHSTRVLFCVICPLGIEWLPTICWRPVGLSSLSRACYECVCYECVCYECMWVCVCVCVCVCMNFIAWVTEDRMPRAACTLPLSQVPVHTLICLHTSGKKPILMMNLTSL